MAVGEPSVRFIADANVGRLAKWLRAMGYDTVYARYGDDRALVRRALREGRAIVTKDRKLLERRVVTDGTVKVAAITADHLREQLREFGRVAPLKGHRQFTRCMECNVPLDSVERETVHELVPAYVYRTQTTFSRCPICERVYWPGTHWRNMRNVLQEVLG